MPSSNLTELTIAREYLYQRLDSANDCVKKFKDSDNIIQLEERLPIISGLFNEFHKLQLDILSKISEAYENAEANKQEEYKASLSEHEEATNQFERLYFSLVASIKSKINESNSANNASTSQESHCSNARTQLELPKYELPTFSGDLAKFMAFHDSFDSLIHKNDKLSEIQKFHFLQSSLKGEAARVIEAFVVSGANYQEAWKAVIKRYKNDRLIVQKHVMNIFESPSILKTSHTAVRVLLDDITINLSALRALDIETNQWYPFLVPVMAEKLDYLSKKEWQTRLTTKIPSFEEFISFLETRYQVLESVHAVDNKKPINVANNTKYQQSGKFSKPNYFQKSFAHLTANKGNNSCSFCKQPHIIYQCKEFLELSIKRRLAEANKLGLCTNCLKPHKSECKSAYKCKLCHDNHNTLLHQNEASYSQPNTSLAHCSRLNSDLVLLSTALVLIKGVDDKLHKCRVLLDQGSQSNFLTSEMLCKLGVPSENIEMRVSGIGQATHYINKSAQIKLLSRVSDFEADLNCLIVPKITNNLPNIPVNLHKIKMPPNIELADPQFAISGPIDMLIGAQLFWQLLLGQTQALGKDGDGPFVQQTHLGWILGGPVGAHKTLQAASVCHVTTELETIVERFWAVDSVPEAKPLSAEEKACETHFSKTIKRDAEGRFIAELPVKGTGLEIRNSSEIAIKRFHSLEAKLARSTLLKSEYTNFMDEYEELKHMEAVPPNEINKSVVCYFPHHAVVREESLTTKCRVVFDASAKTSNGLSLNDNLLAGPVIQPDLFSLLISFRTFRYALTADITKMYRQIDITPEQRDLQRIFWRDDKSKPVKIFRLKTLTYGTKPASFIATRCLQQLADENQSVYPKACEAIKGNFYMDDLLTGDDSLENAIRLRKEIAAVLAQGKFELRKWASNDPRAVLGVEDKAPNAVINFNDGNDLKVLGVSWNGSNDTFGYKGKSFAFSENVTKRSILSVLAQMFDPLGYLSPVIIVGKTLMQKLWATKVNWDDPVPEVIARKWLTLLQEIHFISAIKIPRFLLSDLPPTEIEIHGFCDSSERAYGAAIYLRIVDNQGRITIKLICAKSRVAPLKSLTIPRLELCGALLLARLFSITFKILKTRVKTTNNILWTDSTIVLAWLKCSIAWKTFVANRVAEIHDLTSGIDCKWRHVKGEENPADLITRGLSPGEIINHKLWWSGPSWLTNQKSFWPKSSSEPAQIDLPEKRTLIAVTKPTQRFTERFDRFSSFNNLQRAIAYCLRYVQNLRIQVKRKKTADDANRAPALIGELSLSELENSRKVIIKCVQKDELFNHQLNKFNTDKLSSLDPFIDDDGILRVGGRLRNSTFAYDKRHPAIMPKGHHVSRLLIDREHRRLLHAGAQATLSSLRQQYWIIAGRNAVKRELRKCVTCFRSKPILLQQKMGDLPSHRLEPFRPFYKSGADFAGPILIKESAGRGKRNIKSYIAVFICFATKAIHLELVGDLTAETFLGAFKRFTARRGHVGHLFCDNGTNFVGAKNMLLKNKRLLKSEFNKISTEFHFIPPKGPNFGGLWESAVKSVKNHLNKILMNSNVTYEEMYTLLVQIEACLNSRPLTPLSSDPNDLSVLTPGHFLIGEPLTALPEGDLTELRVNRLTRWQRIEQLRQHLWRRFSREYISQLQGRSKWHHESRVHVKPGDLVLIQEDNAPPLQWPLARVERLHLGPDGIARVATLKTNRGETTRPIRRLGVLPRE